MTDTPPDAAVRAPAGRRARGGADARRASRGHPKLVQLPYITRKIPLVTVLDEEGLDHRAQRGHDPGGDRHRVPRRRGGAADVARRGRRCEGTRVHFPRGLPRALIQKDGAARLCPACPQSRRNVVIGGNHTVFAPVYGPPFIRSLDDGRRYATIEDFRNFVKLAYMCPRLPIPAAPSAVRRPAGEQAASRHGL